MPCLQIRLTSANQNINISKELKAQKLTLLRTTIYKNSTAGTSYRGTLFFNLNFFSGYEHLSNLNGNYLVAPITDEANNSMQTYQMNQSFSGEDIKQSFNVKTFIRDANDNFVPAEFDTTGATAGSIMYIDLMFQVSQLYEYN